MKNLLCALTFVCLIGLSSCTSYYYSILDTTNKGLVKDNNGDFVLERDSVRIIHSFYGEDAPIGISIYNKTDQPLYVDWSRSAIVIDDVATSYKGDNIPINGNFSSGSFRMDYNYSSTNGSFSGSASLPPGITFIPPKSKIEYTPLRLENFSFDEIPNDQYESKSFCKNSGELVKIKSTEFTEENTPLQFRSYLTLYTATDKDHVNPLVYETEFYVSELIKTGKVSPKDFAFQRGDQFYVAKTKGQGAAVIGATIAVVVASSAVEVAVQKSMR